MKFIISLLVIVLNVCTSTSSENGTASQKKGVGCIEGNCENGRGTYVSSDNGRYEGEWKDGKKHGKGTMIVSDGNKYVGDFLNDNLHGQGIYTWANGNKYEGEWQNNQRNGNGKMTTAEGEYDGEWQNNQKNGNGKMTTSEYEYTGEWKENEKDGKGRVVMRNGSKYEGEFSKGQMSGNGIMTSPEGVTSKVKDGKIAPISLNSTKELPPKFMGSLLIPELLDCKNIYYGEETDPKFADEYFGLLLDIVNQKRRGSKISIKKTKCPQRIQNKKAIGRCQFISKVDDNTIDETKKSIDKAMSSTVVDQICYNEKCKKECGKNKSKPDEKYIEKY